jgi:hypothetical protein
MKRKIFDLVPHLGTGKGLNTVPVFRSAHVLHQICPYAIYFPAITGTNFGYIRVFCYGETYHDGVSRLFFWI